MATQAQSSLETESRDIVLVPANSWVEWALALLFVLLFLLFMIDFTNGPWNSLPDYAGLIFGLLIGAVAVVSIRRAQEKAPRMLLTGEMLRYRTIGGLEGTIDLSMLGGAFARDYRHRKYSRIWLDFRTHEEQQMFNATGGNPPHRQLGYVNQIPLYAIVERNLKRAQAIADAINDQRALNSASTGP